MTTSTDPLTFNEAGVGVWGPPISFEVTAERISEYAKATNDPIAAHLAGEVAPPVFAVIPMFEGLTPAVLSIAPEALLNYVVHGEQDIRFYEPLTTGLTLVSRAKPVGFEGKSSGTRATVYVESRDQAGKLVTEQWVTFFFRGFDAGTTIGDGAPAHRLDPSVLAQPVLRVVRQHIDADQTFRYGPAAGDPMPIHLDEAVAKAAGLPGIIVHGLCTLAFTSWATLRQFAGEDASRIRRLAVRFSKPVLPGQDITTSYWQASQSPEVTSYAFQTAVGDATVLTDGLVEIRR